MVMEWVRSRRGCLKCVLFTWSKDCLSKPRVYGMACVRPNCWDYLSIKVVYDNDFIAPLDRERSRDNPLGRKGHSMALIWCILAVILLVQASLGVMRVGGLRDSVERRMSCEGQNTDKVYRSQYAVV